MSPCFLDVIPKKGSIQGRPTFYKKVEIMFNISVMGAKITLGLSQGDDFQHFIIKYTVISGSNQLFCGNYGVWKKPAESLGNLKVSAFVERLFFYESEKTL